jgi:oligopeptide/dipeptide ABC transporter ATP-binding protein
MRVVDTMIAFPALLVTIYLATILGPSLGLFGLALGLAIPSAFRFARIVSTLALSIGGRDYLHAARVIGVRPPRLLLRYILPNMAETLIIGFAVGVSGAVLALSGLSFLGLGVQPPDFDWGSLLTEGVNSFYLTPAAALGPMVFIGATALAFGFSGEALARVINPLLRVAAQPQALHTAVRVRSGTPADDVERTDTPSSGERQMGGRDEAALEVLNLRVQFPRGAGVVNVVSNVSFVMREGEVLGIVGESGSGKTMTALAIAQLVPYPGRVSGEVKMLGQPLRALSPAALARFLGTDLSFVFQDPMSSLNPALTIGTQVTESVEHHRRVRHSAAIQLAIARLREVNIPAAEHAIQRHPHELSGGMRQRAMIAMGLMNEPKLLICDEPTTALDVTIQAQIMDLLAEVNAKRKLATILISHNLGLVKQNCSRVLVMYAGRIVEDMPTDRLLVDPLHPYTRALLAAVPDISRPRRQSLAFIPGEAPDPSSPPSGCPFHPRCPAVKERCLVESPPLLTRSNGRRVACWVANEDSSGE